MHAQRFVCIVCIQFYQHKSLHSLDKSSHTQHPNYLNSGVRSFVDVKKHTFVVWYWTANLMFLSFEKHLNSLRLVMESPCCQGVGVMKISIVLSYGISDMDSLHVSPMP